MPTKRSPVAKIAFACGNVSREPGVESGRSKAFPADKIPPPMFMRPLLYAPFFGALGELSSSAASLKK